MQRVIEQLREIQDPALFSQKINKILDLIDDWEECMVKRESIIVESRKQRENEQQNLKNSENAKFHQKFQERKAILLKEKSELDQELGLLEKRERELDEQRDQHEGHMKEREEMMQQQINNNNVAAEKEFIKQKEILINEKQEILAITRENYFERTESHQLQEEQIKKQKTELMSSWDNIILQAHHIKLIEQENIEMSKELKQLLDSIKEKKIVLDKQSLSLQHMKLQVVHKKSLEEREKILQAKEEKISLLLKELATLKMNENTTHPNQQFITEHERNRNLDQSGFNHSKGKENTNHYSNPKPKYKRNQENF